MLQSEIDKIIKKISDVLFFNPDRILIVSTEFQKLYVVERGKIIRSYDVSTSRYGIGNREGSNMTPRGIHRIEEKIGSGAPAGRIFESRNDTGINWHSGLTGDNLILSRILRLRGLEIGVNSGPGIDSYERYIYIHGTNQEHRIGTPNSHGCICMRNQDIIELFDSVEEGTIVFID